MSVYTVCLSILYSFGSLNVIPKLTEPTLKKKNFVTTVVAFILQPLVTFPSGMQSSVPAPPPAPPAPPPPPDVPPPPIETEEIYDIADPGTHMHKTEVTVDREIFICRNFHLLNFRRVILLSLSTPTKIKRATN